MRPAVEILAFPGQSPRTAALFDELQKTAGPRSVCRTDTYRGAAPWLVLWGPGAGDRQEPMRRQLASGGHVIAWDAAYWSRDVKWRVSIDAPHPQAWVMLATASPARLAKDPPNVRDLWNPAGAVVVAGIGAKAMRQYGAEVVVAWESQMIAEALATGREVRYRPKRGGVGIPAGCSSAIAGDIDHALGGASALITWHSNVAVDAVRLGIPAICRDGAAAAVCPSRWPEQGAPQPLDQETRLRFLERLAYFQWRPSEAAACWQFLDGLLA